MFKNKHIITAIIVTPILAVLAYFATDHLVSEVPHKAKRGGYYPLVKLPNCRYASGKCELKNGNFSIVITGAVDSEGGLTLNLKSAFTVDDIKISVVEQPSDIVGPTSMARLTDDGKEWQLQLPVMDPTNQYLRVAVVADKAAYYAETKMPFLHYETSFKKDFRPN